MNPRDVLSKNEDELIYLYINNKFTPEEAIQFEEFILDKPHIIEKLQLDELMQASLSQHTNAVAANDSWWKPMYANLLSVAACSVLVVMTITMQLNVKSIDGQQIRFETSPDIIYADTLRGSAKVLKVEFSKHDLLKILVIDIPTNNLDMFDITLINNQQLNIGNIQVRLNENGELIYLLSGTSLSAGLYRVRVEQAASVITEIELQVSWRDE